MKHTVVIPPVYSTVEIYKKKLDTYIQGQKGIKCVQNVEKMFR